jgi:aldose 1-epimerase
MDLITLENTHWKVMIAPSVGASIANCFVKQDKAWQPLMRETSAELIERGNPSNYSSFTLAPFSNRLKDAKFIFETQSYQLQANTDGNTQHGDVRSRIWEVLATDKAMLEARINSRDFPEFNFPFPFVLVVLYILEDQTFTTHLRLTNSGDSSMPAGFGIHPYFNRFLNNDEVKLQFSADDVYLTEDLLPTGERMPISKNLDFSNPRAVKEQSINHVFRNFRNLNLHYPGFTVNFECDPVFEHLVIYTPPDGSLAVEPVTNAADGFNLFARGLEGTGVKVLKTGEALEGSIHLVIK